jgi:transposase-like protein
MNAREKKRKASREMKMKAYRLYIEGSETQSEIARKVGVTNPTIARWATDGNWKERKKEAELAIMEAEDRRLRLLVSTHRITAIERQLKRSERIGKRIDDKVESDEDLTAKDLSSIANAHKAVSSVESTALAFDQALSAGGHEKASVSIGHMILNVSPVTSYVNERLSEGDCIDVESGDDDC